MLRLRELMTAPPVTIEPGASLREAVDLLTAANVSALPVVESGYLVGLVSAQGIVAFASAAEPVLTRRGGGDAWKEDRPTDEAIADATSAAYFAELDDDGTADVVEEIAAYGAPAWDFLAAHTVDEAMHVHPPRLRPLACACVAAKMMRRTGSHGVVVVEGTRVVGIVTTMDITRAYEQRSQ